MVPTARLRELGFWRDEEIYGMWYINIYHIYIISVHPQWGKICLLKTERFLLANMIKLR